MPYTLPQHWNAHVRRPHAEIVVRVYYRAMNGLALHPGPYDAHLTILVPIDPRVTCQLVKKLCLSVGSGTELMQISIRSALSPSEKERATEALLPIVVYGRLASAYPLNTIYHFWTPNQQALVSIILFLPEDPWWPLL